MRFPNTLGRVWRHINHLVERARVNEMLTHYHLDPTFKVSGEHVYFYGDGDIVGGRDSYIGDFGGIQVFEGCKVTIGSHVAISHNVRIYTSSRKARDHAGRRSGDVTIGNDVWIGVNVYIGPGVTIGDGATIGANTVITRDVPVNAVVTVKLDVQTPSVPLDRDR